MKVAIHRDGSWNQQVIAYCEKQGIAYLALDFLSSGIISQLVEQDVTHIFWLYHHANPNDLEFSSNILSSVEKMDIKVFPDYNTRFHFDDKVVQKYLFEALGVDSPLAWAFFSEKNALEWSFDAKLPVVAKLKGGAGSYNVRLINTRKSLNSYIRKCFRSGIKNYPSISSDLLNKTKQTRKKLGFKGVLLRALRIPRFLKAYHEKRKYSPIDIGYAYFQEFIPENDSDIRVTVVGDKAWAFIRYVRENDFRASGSGDINYNYKKIPLDLIEKSFKTVNSLKMQSCCMDWVYSKDEESFKLVEVSMGFLDEAVIQAGGYFNRAGSWVETPTSGCIEAFKNLIKDE